MKTKTKTKTITLSFEVPADLDLPSEDLARMKQFLLDGLRYHSEKVHFAPRNERLVNALLTES